MSFLYTESIAQPAPRTKVTIIARPPKTPSEDELSLWQLAMRDVKKLFGGHETEIYAAPEPPRKKSPDKKSELPPFAPAFGLKLPEPSPPAIPGAGLDRRTEDKFRKGQMPIEARLDLHGLTLREAEPAVRDFIRAQHASGRRCVLIITGKGQTTDASSDRAWYESAKGQIKRSLQHWLAADDLRALILSVSPAQRHHGGGGAFYILLRRHR